MEDTSRKDECKNKEDRMKSQVRKNKMEKIGGKINVCGKVTEVYVRKTQAVNENAK